jgi:anti-anti-sigma regulatory factor
MTEQMSSPSTTGTRALVLSVAVSAAGSATALISATGITTEAGQLSRGAVYSGLYLALGLAAGALALPFAPPRAAHRFGTRQVVLGGWSVVAAAWLLAGTAARAVVLRAASPHDAILGRLPDTDTYRDTADHPEATTTPGLVVYRFDAPLFFANAAQLRDSVLAAIETADPKAVHVLMDCELIYDIDASGAQVLIDLLDTLDRREVAMTLARVRTEVREQLDAAGISGRLASPGIHLEVDDGVREFTRQHGGGG